MLLVLTTFLTGIRTQVSKVTFNRAAFARRILAVGGWPSHLNNHVALVAWMEGEFSITFGGAKAHFNPLATTRPESGSTDFNTVHVKNYISFEQGVKASVDTINNGKYPDVIINLKKKSASSTTLRAVAVSPWGTHFNGDEYNFVESVRNSWSTHAFYPIPG